MVDTVEAAASIEEVDVNPNSSKSVSHLEQKQEHGFSAEQLRADIDFAQLKQTTQEKLKEQGIPAIVPKPNSKQVLMGQMEQIIAEVFHYKTIQQYKDKITPEFIALFNEAEQAMLLELIELLDQYLVLQKEYVTELLQLLGYKDSEDFFADIATIPAVASAMEAKKAFLAAMPEAQANYSNLDVAAKVATVIGPCRMFIIPHLMQRVQEEGPVDPNVPNKILIPYLELVQQSTAALADSDLPVELFARAHRLDAMELCYLQDKSQRHAEKRAAFDRLKDYSSAHRFSTVFVKFFTNERIDGLSNIAKSLSDEWMLDTNMGDKVSAPEYITGIRSNATKASITINEAERQMSSRPIELPQDEAENLEEKKVKSRRTRRFTQRFTQMFSRSPVSAESEKPKILQSEPELVSSAIVPEISVPEIKATPVAEKTDISAPSIPELKRSTSDSQLEKPQPKSQLRRTTSLEKLPGKMVNKLTDTAATKLKSAADSIAAIVFKNKKSDISAPVSFIDYARTAWSVTETLKKNEGFKKLEFVYNRGDKKIRNKKPKSFREGDFVEICENDTSICTIVPQKLPKDTENEASGVGVTVHRHTDPDIRFAVRLMVEALAQQGEKQIYVTVSDRGSPEGRELALKYVDVIFSEGAIPVLQDENGKVLNKEETKNELQRMVDAHDASAPSKIAKYRFLSERYESEIERIEAAEKADKLYLDEFAEFIESSEEGSSEFKKVITVVSKLADIAFVNHNLSRDDFIDCLLKYLQKGYPGRNPLYIERAKKELKILLDNRLSDMSEVLPLEQIVQEAFNLAADRLDINLQISSGNLKVMSRQEQVEKDLLFLMFFENWLQNPQSSIPDEKGNVLDAHQILTRLAQIALIQKAIDESAFLDKIISFAWASSPHSSGAALSDQKRESLKKSLLIGQLKPYQDHLDPEHIGEFAYKLVDIARHELKFGHVAEEIRGQGFLHHHVSTKTSEHVLADSDGDGEKPVFHKR